MVQLKVSANMLHTRWSGSHWVCYVSGLTETFGCLAIVAGTLGRLSKHVNTSHREPSGP
ncbi:hypothetical protein SCOCK_370046 [Actinacidiphila cocklensis]|uniref:Uncharacterized protein n=1 Tax=Actinacidiphila cocklensis TaxID=887465 RepID=A0A9W4DYL8_9ACTN|nr:hypothetical protein SCOCK_370046 [Actinacidiphila cocklensis]